MKPDPYRLPSEMPRVDEYIHDEIHRLLPPVSEASVIHDLVTRGLQRRRRYLKGAKP